MVDPPAPSFVTSTAHFPTSGAVAITDASPKGEPLVLTPPPTMASPGWQDANDTQTSPGPELELRSPSVSESRTHTG